MTFTLLNLWKLVKNWALILLILLVSLWLIVIQPLGPGLSRLPGDLGDSRLNNYILEHDYRWLKGTDPSLWNMPDFYPYPLTLAFSDNHLGSMFFYSAFRRLRFSREQAFQAWYILSFCLNYFASAVVLKRFNLKPLAIALGSFFFTLGLPVFGQETHVQLFYRFGVPLACFALWQFTQTPHWKYFIRMLFWLVWQFWLSIYIGYFLTLLLAAAFLLIPLQEKSLRIDKYWFSVFKRASQSLLKKQAVLFGVAGLGILNCLVLLLYPYLSAQKIYGFTRSWGAVVKMLPTLQSYLTADQAVFWKPVSLATPFLSSARGEHQLFIGIIPVLLLLLGGVWRFSSPHRKMALAFLSAAGLLVILTLNLDGRSLYHLLWIFPGVNSIRAVTRIILVLMWPVALFLAVEVDALLRLPHLTMNYAFLSAILLTMMMAESIYTTQPTYSIQESITRLQKLDRKIPALLPADPVLYVWNSDEPAWYLTELDAMLLSQNLNWPVLNGYSGNFPPGYGSVPTCDQVPARITGYLEGFGLVTPDSFNQLARRLVIIGPVDCLAPLQGR